MSDRERLDYLLCQIKVGDEKAFEELYNSTSQKVFGYVLSMLNNYHTAQDITQDTFIKIRKNVDKYQSGNAFAWIMQIAKNTTLNYLNKSKKTINIDELPSKKCKSYTMDEGKIPIMEIIATRLEDTDKKILLMHLTGGFKHREIAKDLDLPLGTVLWRYNKAIKTLQNIIKEEYGE